MRTNADELSSLGVVARQIAALLLEQARDREREHGHSATT